MVLRSDECRRRYRRREPERGRLHHVLLAHLESFLAAARERDDGCGLPSFVVREIYRYLGCGLRAFDHALCAAVRRIFMRAVLGWYERRARRDGVASPRGGAIVFRQRFGGAPNLNLHFHALMRDGVCACASTFARPVFHAAPPLEDAEVKQLTRRSRCDYALSSKSLGRTMRGRALLLPAISTASRRSSASRCE